jgi:hypothetical protein
MAEPRPVSRIEFAKFKGVRWNAMNDICALSHIKDLTPVQRVAHLAHWYMSEVYNGGHYQYFVNKRTYNHEEVIRALQEIGATEHAATLASALKKVTASPVGSPQTVEEFLVGQAEVDLSIYDAAFNKCPRKVEDSLEDFLDKHEREFIEWTP